MNIRTTTKYGTGGESYLFTPGEGESVRVSLRDIPHDRYKVFFDIVKGPSGCTFSVWQRQTQISDWFDTYAPVEARVNDMYVCDLDRLDIVNTITINFKTEKQKNSLLLNRIILIRKQ